MDRVVSYIWWGTLGATFVGWISALLASWTLLAPAGLLGGTPDGTGLAAVAFQARALVLAGLAMGAAASTCLAHHLRLHPSRTRNLVADALSAVWVVVLVVGLHLGLQVFSGHLAGLLVGTSGVVITTIDVLPPEQQGEVEQDFRACGTGFSLVQQSYRDTSASVQVRHLILLYPWRYL